MNWKKVASIVSNQLLSDVVGSFSFLSTIVNKRDDTPEKYWGYVDVNPRYFYHSVKTISHWTRRGAEKELADIVKSYPEMQLQVVRQ